MTTEEKLRAYILEELQFGGAPEELTSDYPLLESDAIDSLAVFSLVSYCEDEFGVYIPDEELLPDNFASIGAIARLIESRKNA